MKGQIWGINVVGPRGINADNDVAIGPNEDGTKVQMQIGNAIFDEDDVKAATQIGPATEEEFGLIKQAEEIEASQATDIETLKADFNLLLAKLKAAGIIASGEVSE